MELVALGDRDGPGGADRRVQTYWNYGSRKPQCQGSLSGFLCFYVERKGLRTTKVVIWVDAELFSTPNIIETTLQQPGYRGKLRTGSADRPASASAERTWKD